MQKLIFCSGLFRGEGSWNLIFSKLSKYFKFSSKVYIKNDRCYLTMELHKMTHSHQIITKTCQKQPHEPKLAATKTSIFLSLGSNHPPPPLASLAMLLGLTIFGLIIIDETKRNETKFCEILRNTAKYCEILRNMKKYGQITTKNAKILKPYHKYSLPWTQCGRQSSHGHTEKAEVCTTD